MIVQIATKCSENFLTNFECVWSIFFIRNLDLKSLQMNSQVSNRLITNFYRNPQYVDLNEIVFLCIFIASFLLVLTGSIDYLLLGELSLSRRLN